jgi:hypothetical protein
MLRATREFPQNARGGTGRGGEAAPPEGVAWLFEEAYLAAVREEFARQRALAEGAIGQLADEELVRAPGAGANSVAVLMKHVGGNLRSRWREFPTADGEAPDRDRDAEFLPARQEDLAAVRRVWEQGWEALDRALAGIGPQALGGVVTIRGEPHSVPRAIERSLAHTAHHVGQIVYAAKVLRGLAWRTLSIPPGASRAYTEAMRRRFGGPDPARA